MKRLSIIIPAYNEAQLLKNCLDSIICYTRGVDYEIAVVDNSSTDDVCTLMKSSYPHIQFIPSGGNRGYTHALNQGARATDSKYVCFLNQDTLIQGNVFEEMLSYSERLTDGGVFGVQQVYSDGMLIPKSYARPSLAAIAFHILDCRRLLSTRMGRWGLGRWERRNHNVASYTNSTTSIVEPCMVEVVSGFCMLVRRQAYEAIGFCDEKYFYGPDDWDMCIRMKTSGRGVYLLPVQVTHLKQKADMASVAKERRHVFTPYYAGLFYFCRKHFGLRGLLFVKLFMPVMLVLKAVSLLIEWIISLDRTIWCDIKGYLRLLAVV